MPDHQVPPTRIGVVLVHGIGEQRRFEHLDGQVRQLLTALKARPDTDVTVEIRSGQGAAFEAVADTWQSDIPVVVHVSERNPERHTVIEFHEVWWADVNEPYSLIKQVRFWLWAITVWLYPDKRGSILPQAVHVSAPATPGRQGMLQEAWTRIRLIGVAVVAVAAAASIGFVSFLAERLFKLQPPDFLRTFVNYVAGVKLYNQKSRLGSGLPAKPADFLDAVGEPPRVSVRRRMIRVLLNVAQANYDRWYVFAHSLGSVVAFNGLMETAYSWPGYFDQADWATACGGATPLGGSPRPGWRSAGPPAMPARPTWLAGEDIAYRSRIFHKLHGFVTYGCPLEKFAAVWPARVPITKEPAFRAGTQWFNVFDPTDPVSGVLKSFGSTNPHCCPPPQNFGFAAGSVLLWSHLQYLRKSKRHTGLADALIEWMLSGDSNRVGQGREWFEAGSPRHWRRSFLAWVSWLVALAFLCLLGGVILPPVGTALRSTYCAAAKHLDSLGLPGAEKLQCAPETTPPQPTPPES